MDSNMKSVLRNYMQKCGEGRGLEKFLRRNSFSSGDERETSCTITTSKSRNKTKSLESLNEKPTSNSPKTPPKSLPTPPPPATETDSVKPMETAKFVIKQSSEKVDKKKSFNYESIIEITLPQQQQHQQPSIYHDQQQVKDKSADEKLEDPIRPIISTPKQSKIQQQMINSDKKLSPSSGGGNDNESFVSNKQNPMEWDSFIPGFETSLTAIENNNNNTSCSEMQLCNPMELDDKELNALKTYFQQRGLKLPNENLIVVIKNRQQQQQQERVTEKQFENIRKNKEKWQNIFDKYKDKYQPSFYEPDAQSTPKVPETSTSVNVAMEKGSQTSLVKNAVKSVQVEITKDEKQQEVYFNPSEVAESFEFVRGSRIKEKSKKSSSSSSESSANIKNSSVASEAGSSKNSAISESMKNDNITNFDDSLKVAIALLNSLLDSSMRPELKRNLAEKVIQKIVQLQTSRSIQTSTVESSENYPRSNSSVKSVKENSSVKSEKNHKNREEVLRDCLKPMTRSEVSHQNSQIDESTKGNTISSTQSIPKSQLVDFVRREKNSQLKWIEKEIEHLNNLRDLLKRNETPHPNDPIYENMSGAKKKMAPPPPPPPLTEPNVWNSHANMKKVKNRSKLQTPVTNEGESLASFIETRNKKFLEKYKEQQKHLYEDYTRPYSERNEKIETVIKSKKSHKTATKDVQTSTSLASSSVFESSDSISVPEKKSSSTTTHYETEAFKTKERRHKVAVTQTTDSICRTKPIYEVRNDKCDTMSTRRVKKIQNDKQMQAKPPSIKYTLTFDKKNRANIRQYSSLPQQQQLSEYATITKNSKDIYNRISYSASLNYREYVENKENYDVLIDKNNDDNEGQEEDIDLQKCLNHNRPEIFSRVEQRKKHIDELKKLRALRNEHRAKLLLLTSEKSLEGKLFSSLPDLPLKKSRMFSTKDLKMQTKKVVKNLDEVQRKKKEENLKNLKRKTRLMTEIFNKNLQKNVLKGNMNLSYTVNHT